MYEGRTAAEPGIVFGHENMGIIDEVGPGVTVSAVGIVGSVLLLTRYCVA